MKATRENDNVGDPRTGLRLLRRITGQREYGVLAVLILTVAVVSIVNPAFLGAGNIRDMLVKCAPVVIVACGVTLVIMTGEIDISVGSMMGLLAAVLGILTSPDRLGGPVWLGIVATLCAGAAIGFINGLLVTVGRVPSIIVTLGMLTALRGITELLMHGEWIENLPAGLRFLGTGTVLGVPVCVVTALAIVALFSVLTRQTPLGRRIYAVGSNLRSAMLAGISPQGIKIVVFTITGFLTGLATLVSVTQLSVIESGIGVGFELLVVTCVVVGGTSISGGCGSVVGSALGVLLLGTVGTVLIFLRLGEQSTYWERAIQGGFILVAVLVDHVARGKDRPA
jgi:ribose/xylose/arabinose/galactoside ABC-type transport system permease subunit